MGDSSAMGGRGRGDGGRDGRQCGQRRACDAEGKVDHVDEGRGEVVLREEGGGGAGNGGGKAGNGRRKVREEVS